eukprot:TRINITY_DN189_c0_g1_i1.p1 TRINITY_DN189_c0_g1~~TRINITY_DN189_c0_g1_i1.p1  ORF type:complete len:199 (-),score=22.32 TRINITY_DN189_c0_g1_i1:163-693(-)
MSGKKRALEKSDSLAGLAGLFLPIHEEPDTNKKRKTHGKVTKEVEDEEEQEEGEDPASAAQARQRQQQRQQHLARVGRGTLKKPVKRARSRSRRDEDYEDESESSEDSEFDPDEEDVDSEDEGYSTSSDVEGVDTPRGAVHFGICDDCGHHRHFVAEGRNNMICHRCGHRDRGYWS